MSSNPFDFFDKITCINLNIRKDRWAQSLIQFKTVGIDTRVERFEAVLNEEVPTKGFYDSLMGVIEEARDSNAENLLSLEDDVVFEEDIQTNLTKAIYQLPKDWGLFFLGCNIVAEAKKISPNILQLEQAYATHAMAINSNLFDYMLNESTRGPALDVWISENIIANKYKPCYAMYPIGAVQRDSYSNIEKRFTTYTHFKPRYENHSTKE